MRGDDIEVSPVFFAYVVITQNELYLYLLDEQRITDKIYNHFFMEGLDVILQKYNNTLAGIDSMVCKICRKDPIQNSNV